MNLNLTRLFELQKELDERIVRDKQLEGQDLLPNKILALQVELGELANEWRGFKHWSSDREPRREKMLEEYVDCLHFMLSIGIDVGIGKDIAVKSDKPRTEVIDMLLLNMWYLADSFGGQKPPEYHSEIRMDWPDAMSIFLGLGEMLGFTPEQIESAYLTKNAVNHHRQETNY